MVLEERGAEPGFIYIYGWICVVVSVSRRWSCIQPCIRGIEEVLLGKRFMVMFLLVEIDGYYTVDSCLYTFGQCKVPSVVT